MSSSTEGSSRPNTQTASDYLTQLNALVPSSLDDYKKLNGSQKADLSEKITDILWQVFDNQSTFEPEQRSNLMKIREVARKAEKMELISEPGKKILSKIVSSTRKLGLSIYTSPRDLKIKTKDGEIDVNSDILVKNSAFFKTMLKSGMKEEKNQTVELKNFSNKSVELLVRCLHAPKASEIILPADGKSVLELLGLAMTYGFDKLLKKLEPAVSRLIVKEPEAVLKNIDAWMNFLIPYKNDNEGKGKHSGRVTKWMLEITPKLLEHYDIPVNSIDSRQFEIPTEHSHTFFDEDTRDLFQHLPVLLEIKDKEGFALLESTAKKSKLHEPLSIKVLFKQELTKGEEKRIHKLFEASNVNLTFEESLPQGTTLFGKEQWEKYHGKIGEAPPLPKNITSILTAPSPYFPGKTRKETDMLVLIPSTVNGKPLNLKYLIELYRIPKEGKTLHNIRFSTEIMEQHGDKAFEHSHWVLMSKKAIPDSSDKTYEEHKTMVAKDPTYAVPDLLSASICMLTHFADTGVRLKLAFTCCRETVTIPSHRGSYILNTSLVNFNKFGLDIETWDGKSAGVRGVVPIRSFLQEDLL